MRREFFAIVTLLLTFGLSVATSAAQVTPSADLTIISNTANVRHAKVGQDVTFTVVAANNGPDALGELDVYVPGDTFGDSLQGVSTTCDFGVSPDGLMFCEYGGYHPVQVGENVKTIYVVQVRATDSKQASVTACVTSYGGPYGDPDTANDCATASVRIIGKRG